MWPRAVTIVDICIHTIRKIKTVVRDIATLLLAIIGMMILEGIVLGVLWRRRHQGIRPAQLAANLMAGISLLLATVAVVVAGAGPFLMVFLALALVMHVADLYLRWTY